MDSTISPPEFRVPAPEGARPMYLDCNGSTPVEPEVLRRFNSYLADPAYQGNSSAGHARQCRAALKEARTQLAAWANGGTGFRPAANEGCTDQGVFFCASATEANNMAILGLLQAGRDSGRKHIIATELEHASVLKPCQYLAERHGFTLTLVAPQTTGEAAGRIAVDSVMEQLRPETLLICCMQVSNEIGVVQPVAELAETLLRSGHPAYLHVDAVQGAAHLGADSGTNSGPDGGGLYPESALCHPRIDMLSISGHKMYGICGIAALLLKQRPHGRQRRHSNFNSNLNSNFNSNFKGRVDESLNNLLDKPFFGNVPEGFPPLEPLLFGGGQQGGRELTGLRSGSVPVALALSLRDALELCEEQRALRRKQNLEFRRHFLDLLAPLEPRFNGAVDYVLPHVCNLSLPNIDAESALLNVRSLLSAGRGAACSGNQNESGSRVLAAIGLDAEQQNNALRFSWWHGSPRFWRAETEADTEYSDSWAAGVVRKLQRLKT
ncbi:aminotransferase class V-fold PLP-dependent enzyme [Candidatus Haliotispira prima]|uniref:Aminotransferase class V-fold PLP-dependent enzyme n=1 Tax=Candidatus Haliotispira prima TaxID=3034016 RepID=A0ABY8MIV2_9SPIO|nr:aminotransferase class V-fold PLP-dependent enzyme [Candidatus Haliotispira prima]